MEYQTILITGATGYIGRRLTHQLLEKEQFNIRLLVRNTAKVQVGIAEQVDIREGDTFNQEKLKSALEGVDVAFYLIHSMGSEKDYSELDRISAENFRDACINAGVRRIIYLGGLGVKEDASKHLLSRIETGEVLSARSDKIQTIWIRAGVIIGSGSASFEIIRNLIQKLPIMITPLWVRTRTQPIGIDDVLAYLESSILLPNKKDLIVDIGSENMDFQEMMQQASKVMGLKRFLIPVPFLSPRLSSYWLILFTPIPYRLASALVEGLKSETTLQNTNAKEYYNHINPRSFRETVQLAMDEIGRQHVVSRWCDSSGRKACDIKDFDDPTNSIYRDVRIVAYSQGEQQEDVFKAACSIGGQSVHVQLVGKADGLNMIFCGDCADFLTNSQVVTG